MKHSIFSHVLTILVVVWLAALGAAGILYPERTSALFEKAMAVAAESEGGPEAGSESLLTRINVAKLFENSLGNWLVFVSAVFVGILAGKIAAAVLARVGRRLDARGWTARAHLANDLVGPASLALFTLGLAVGLAALEMSDPLRTFSCQNAAVAVLDRRVLVRLQPGVGRRRRPAADDGPDGLEARRAARPVDPQDAPRRPGGDRRVVRGRVRVRAGHRGVAGGLGDRRSGRLAGRPGFAQEPVRLDHDPVGPAFQRRRADHLRRLRRRGRGDRLPLDQGPDG